MPFWLIKARSGCHTASARVVGGTPGTSGSGAQSVASMVAAMRQATKRNARRQPRLRGDQHQHRARQHGRRAVAEGRGRGGQCPLARRNRIDPIRIDHDVLRCGQERHQNRDGTEQRQSCRRGTEAHDADANGERCLKHQNPTAAPAQEWRQVAVEERRPQEFEDVGQCHQREYADGLDAQCPSDASHACREKLVRLNGSPEAKLIKQDRQSCACRPAPAAGWAWRDSVKARAVCRDDAHRAR